VPKDAAEVIVSVTLGSSLLMKAALFPEDAPADEKWPEMASVP
jgi:hypothetical protein